MGLDMYLSAEKSIGGWNFNSDAEKQQYAAVAEAVGLGGFRCEGAPRGSVKINVAYWRKANAVHKWFVDNVQKGEDDCGYYTVSREKLKELADKCKEVIANSKLVAGQVHVGATFSSEGRKENFEDGKVIKDSGFAEATLPTQSGFFFGGTGYDEYYISDLQDTIDQIEPLLTRPEFEGFEFEYHSSW